MDNSSGTYQVWTTPIDFSTVDVKDVNVLPISFGLEQNYPNPFNPTTTIRFTISDVRFTNLKVYDVLGNVIETLVNEEKPAGEYEIVFSGDDLPSGIYYYRLQVYTPGRAGSFTETRKMILLK